MTIEHKEAKKGYFSASRISDLLAGGTGKTRQSYILDVCLDMLGLKKEFGNAFTEHGINNEIHAFNDVVIKQFPNALLQSDVFININKNLGASSDVVFSNNNDALDIKCPTLLKFHHYKWNTLKSYYDQLQTQLLATKGDTAYLLFYLTKPITWDNADNWKEYEFENENDNFFIKSFPKDEKRQEEILDAVEKAVPIRDEMFYKLLTAPIYDFKYLMNYASTGGGYASIKESSNILKSNIFRYENEFYYFKNK